MCDKAVKIGPSSWEYVSDWFVTQGQVKTWHDDDDYCNDNELIKWYDGYKKRKVQKAQIKEELQPITWHLYSVVDWCVSEDEKKETTIVLKLSDTFLHQ